LKEATGGTDALDVALNAVDATADLVPNGSVIANVTVPDIELLRISTNVLAREPSLSAERYINLFTLGGDDLRSVVVEGDARLQATFRSGTTAVQEIDASHALGGVLFSGRGQAQSVTFLGSAVTDFYTASLHGDTIDPGAGADGIFLALASGFTDGAVDRIVYAAGDSMLSAGFDRISNFGVTTDVRGNPTFRDLLDLSAFGFAPAERPALINRGALAASVVDGSTLFQPGWFVEGGQARAVAIGTQGNDLLPAVNTYVFVDVNRSGDFEAAVDLFIELSGVKDVTLSNFVF
jgi:hypothetical protein